jgi:hypothetical protein
MLAGIDTSEMIRMGSVHRELVMDALAEGKHPGEPVTVPKAFNKVSDKVVKKKLWAQTLTLR